MHFIPNPENKPEVNHINGDKWDNRADNLEWSTSSENSMHAIQTGLQKSIGEENCNAKFTNEEVIEIFNSPLSAGEISLKYNVDVSTISSIKTGKNWSQVTGKKFIKKKILLTESQIKEIKESKELNIVLASKYGVGHHYIGRIKRGVSLAGKNI